MNKLSKISILGVDITNASISDILEYILQIVNSNQQKAKIYTPNPEIIVLAHRNPEFKQILNKAEVAIPDGIGVVYAGRILNKPLKERITGIDLLDLVCRESNNKPISIGLLGAQKGVAEKAVECLREKYPGLNIVFAASELPQYKYGLESRSKKQEAISKGEENKFLNHDSLFLIPSIDVLFVAYGAPKQEKWIAENIERLPVKVMVGVGGAFDIISGEIKRAPKMIRDTHLEWLYRLLRQPWRLKRQLNLLVFIYLVFKEKLIRYY